MLWMIVTVITRHECTEFLRGLSSVCLPRVNSECRSIHTSYVPPPPPPLRIPDYFVVTGRVDSVGKPERVY